MGGDEGCWREMKENWYRRAGNGTDTRFKREALLSIGLYRPSSEKKNGEQYKLLCSVILFLSGKKKVIMKTMTITFSMNPPGSVTSYQKCCTVIFGDTIC